MHDIATTRATERPRATVTLSSVPLPDIAVNEGSEVSPSAAISRRAGASNVLIIFRDDV